MGTLSYSEEKLKEEVEEIQQEEEPIKDSWFGNILTWFRSIFS